MACAMIKAVKAITPLRKKFLNGDESDTLTNSNNNSSTIIKE
jgi:hypothetical protein